ncbi:MAG: hypothetical protein JSS40_09170 [Proteobacteria bacterium]|nr:hypothetical protein [Pseudomonadota bacterium]
MLPFSGHRQPRYYRIRNHLVDFLINRSKLFQCAAEGAPDLQAPVVRPGLEPVIAPAAAPRPAPNVVNLRH